MHSYTNFMKSRTGAFHIQIQPNDAEGTATERLSHSYYQDLMVS